MFTIIKNVILSVLLFSSTILLAQSELDQKLFRYVKTFEFQPVDKLQGKNKPLYYLGKSLFSDKILSGRNNISCMNCHNPQLGTGDSLPLPIGAGGKHEGHKRLNGADIIARNSPPLYNKGHSEFRMFFADMRVYHVKFNNTYMTPEKGLNGVNPEYDDITSALSGPLAAQALFPMVDKSEMLGVKNPTKNRRYYWRVITNRLLKNSKYRDALYMAFPGQKINIGHIGTALAYFQSLAFQVNNTPWDNYLRGHLDAMSFDQKRGALVFIEKALCARCHNGKHLTNFTMHNLAVPPIGPGKNGKGDDLGRYEVLKDERFLYRFMTPPLRNLAKTAPYFHNGSMSTIREVIDHYNDPYKSLAEYDGSLLIKQYQINYQGKLVIENNLNKKKDIISRLSPPFRIPLNLTQEDKKLLELFLLKSLSEN